MKHKGFSWPEILFAFAIVFIGIFIFVPRLFFRGHHYEERPRAMCQSNLKQIGLAFAQYVQDAKEVFPRVAFSPVSLPEKMQFYGWADVIQPYLKSTQLYQCRSEKVTYPTDDPTQAGYIDYWMNSNLSNLPLAALESPAITILSGDGNDSTDANSARYNIKALSQKWMKDKSSPAYRHLDGANYLFADGHVKWFKPEKIKITPVSKGDPTFSFK
jgi:prepilin-type processing-associated H-X9-DG protein